MDPSHRVITSYFLLGNLHCPSCVSSIKNALQPVPGVAWVSPNLVTSWVAVEHDPDVLVTDMAKKLESSGFEVSSTASKDSELTPATLLSQPGFSESGFGVLDHIARLPGMIKEAQAKASIPRIEKRRKHLEVCEHCRRSGGSRPCSGIISNGCSSQLDGALDDEKAARGMIMSTKSLALENDEKPLSPISEGGRRWKASMAISPLMCISCEQSVAEPLKEKQWITKISISYITKSGVVEYIGTKEDAKQIAEMITDTGRDAKLVKVENIDGGGDKRQRTVQIRIDGFYCDNCADRVTNSLGGLRGNLRVVTTPTRKNPILEIDYTPAVPNFTIRRILKAIQATDPAFSPSIHHPPTLEEESKQLDALHQKQMRLRAWFTTIVAIPTFIIGVVYMSLVHEDNASKKYLMAPWTSGLSRAQVALCILATPVYLFAADIFHRRAIMEVVALWRPKKRSAQENNISYQQHIRSVLRRFYRFGSMNMLMSLGTTIAYVSSISQMIVAAVGQPDMVNDSNLYFDSVVFLTFFLLWGRVIEAYSKSKTGDAVEALSKLRPSTAILVETVEDNKEVDREVTTDLLEFGDLVRILHGASPPCDGNIIRGRTDFDESSLTGESRPVKKAPGDDVFSGTINKGAPILVQITGTAGQSMLDNIVSIVRECQTKPSPMENLAGYLTAYFVPFITFIAILTWLIWLSLGISGAIPEHFLDVSSGGWVAFSLQFAISVFVVACPCGIGLATPTAIFVGSGLAAKHGLLAKGGGEAFEKASRIDCVVFDKTGTLTMGGEPKITDFMIFPGHEVSDEQRSTFLAALRATEEKSTHPIAKAIVSFCNTETTERTEVDDSTVVEIPGKGLKAIYYAGSPARPFDIIIGNEALMRDYGVAISPAVATNLQTWKMEAKSIVLVAIKPADKPANPSLAAALSVSDPMRPETPAVIQALKSRGTDVWMLSGDNATTAKAVALQIGIPELNVIAEVLPAQKHEKITYLQSTLKARRGGRELVGRRATVAMVGDGINDAPALSQADVGVAIGSGSDVAISSADFVLVNSSLVSLVTLLDLSAAVFRRIKFNFAWALIYNLLAVPIAAGCLYPVVVGGQHVRLAPVWASLAMALSSISVVLSSLALRSGVPGLGFRVRMKMPELEPEPQPEPEPEVQSVKE